MVKNGYICGWNDAMAKYVLIEILDKQSVWIHFRKVANNPAKIEQALQAALNTPLAAKAKQARCVEAGTNFLLSTKNG